MDSKSTRSDAKMALNPSARLTKFATKIATGILSLIALLTGCQIASQSPHPVDVIKDPLGIDRAINEYYFPDAEPKPKPMLGSQSQISTN